MARRLAFLLAALVLALSACMSLSGYAVLSQVNIARHRVGSQNVYEQPSLQDYARWHNQRLVTQDRLFHSSQAELNSVRASIGSPRVGEILGRVRDGEWEALRDAWLASPTHRPILLDPIYDDVGISVLADKNSPGFVYVTVIFG